MVSVEGAEGQQRLGTTVLGSALKSAFGLAARQARAGRGAGSAAHAAAQLVAGLVPMTGAATRAAAAKAGWDVLGQVASFSASMMACGQEAAAATHMRRQEAQLR